MADTKITALAAIGANPINVATFPIPMVDLLDNSMAASGTTKKVTVNQILGAGGTATLASATITGDLTVDTSTLFVDSANNYVGIGTALPSQKLHLENAGNSCFIRTASTQNPSGFDIGVGGSGDSTAYVFNRNNTPIVFGINATTAMTLNSTGLGVGVASPAAKLDVLGNAALTGTSGFKYLYFNLATDTNSVRGAKIGKNYDSPFDLNIHATTSASGLSNEAAINFYRNLTDVSMTLDASGNLLVGTTSGSLHKFQKAIAVATGLFEISSSSTGSRSLLAYSADAEGWSANTPAIFIGKYSVTGRSINAGGTLNASGADYAEYMVKCSDFVLAKGDVAGIDANGKLTNVFADAISFVVKSTDPSYVGNDKWGIDLEGDALEAARQLVDRIAFAGQVPVNVTGAKAGDYIVPVVDGTGIKGISVSNPTFDQYQLAVGKVIGIDADGRARIIVKVA